MVQTLHRILVHVAFSTKDRGPLLEEPIRPPLFVYLGGIARSLGGERDATQSPGIRGGDAASRQD